MKKIIGLILVLCMMFILAVSVSAEGEPTIYMYATKPNANGIFNVFVAIKDNIVPKTNDGSEQVGLYAYGLKVEYDKSMFKLNTIRKEGTYDDSPTLNSENAAASFVALYGLNKSTMDYETGETTYEYFENTDLLKFYFKINTDVITEETFEKKFEFKFSEDSHAIDFANATIIFDRTPLLFEIPDTRPVPEGITYSDVIYEYTGTALQIPKVEGIVDSDEVAYSIKKGNIEVDEIKDKGIYEVTATVKRTGFKKLVITANVYVGYYQYTFKDEEGNVIKSKIVEENAIIEKPDVIPEKEKTQQYTYTFSHWNGYSEGMIATENIVFEPVYNSTVNHYTYKFLNEDGSVYYEETADYGTIIKVPQAPEKNDDDRFTYEFSKWQDYSEGLTLTKDITFTPTYDAIYKQHIVLEGVEEIVVGNSFTEKVSMVTLKPVNYLICEIIYPDVLELNSITPKDFKYASQGSLKNKDGFNYLTVICQYADDESTAPENTAINPFNISFTVSKTAKPQEIEIKFGEDTYLSGEEDYPFENKINAKTEILPKLASSITITGNSIIYEPTKFTAEVYPDYTTDKTIEWSVDDETVATISKDGILTPVKNGEVTITATAVGGTYRTKTITVYRNAYIDGFKSDVGMWDVKILPDTKEYTIYVTEGTSVINITPLFTTGTLIYDDAIVMKNRPKEFELTEDETIITLARSDAGYQDCTYTIKIIKKPGLKNETIKAESFREDCINILVYNNNAVRIEETEDITITIPEKVNRYKILYWESLSTLKPAQYEPIIKEL